MFPQKTYLCRAKILRNKKETPGIHPLMIRPYRPSDAADLAQIWLNASIAAHRFMDPGFWRSQLAAMRDEHIPAGETYVYEDGGGLQGFITLRDKSIEALFVAPGSQGRGIGRELLNHAKTLRRTLELSVYANNARAAAFFLREEFRQSARRTDPYTGQPEMTMKWSAAKKETASERTPAPKQEREPEAPRPPKEKKIREPKPPRPPKEKKIREPKPPRPPKEKKIREPKPPRPPKEKKIREPKPPRPPKERKNREPILGKVMPSVRKNIATAGEWLKTQSLRIKEYFAGVGKKLKGVSLRMPAVPVGAYSVKAGKWLETQTLRIREYFIRAGKKLKGVSLRIPSVPAGKSIAEAGKKLKGLTFRMPEFPKAARPPKAEKPVRKPAPGKAPVPAKVPAPKRELRRPIPEKVVSLQREGIVRMKKNSRTFIDKYVTPKTVKWFWIIVAAPFALVIFMLLLTSTGIFGRLPSFEELENPKSNIATEIYDDDGEMIGSFYIQNRSFVSYEELSPWLVAALVSTEDARYYSHSGIDFVAMARVAVKTVALGNRSQGGGSTITQQLAKNLFPRDTVDRSSLGRNMRTVASKFKEWITAVKLEYNYTKEEIIAMYLNTVAYGSNAYGIKSAAHTFFGKTPADLNAQESAMLVGVVNAPTKYNPKRNYDRAMARRNTVLSRMEGQHYLSRTELDSLQQTPIDLSKYKPISHNEGTGTYFREMLRMVMTAKRPSRSDYSSEWDYEYDVKVWDRNPLWGWCEKNRKADGTPYNIYRDGIKIYTTIDATMQRYAEQAMQEQMLKKVQPAMDAQVKRTGVLFNNQSKEDVERIVRNAMRYSDRYRALKADGASPAEIDKDFNTPAQMRIFTYKGEVDTLMTPRDSILHHKRIMRAAFMAMDPASGEVKAYVGGPNYRYFKYDMVRQGKRQVGSTIKPFIYTFAIDHLGYTPCTMVPNLQTVIETESGDAWSPREAGRVEYDGVMHPLRWGLALSRNNYSAWIMKQAKQPAAVADFIHKLGIHSYIDPVYALCLGTPDVSLYEMVATYCIYANRGVYTEPIFVTKIEDRHGNLISQFAPTTSDAISEQTAYTMLDMLKFVVSNGTANRLRYEFGVTGEVGGKTGTTQKNADAWFMAVAPKLVAGAWVGAEDPSVHLYSQGEGSVMALPIYGRFMQLVYKDARLGVRPDDKFPIPVGAVTYNCDDETGYENTPQKRDEFFD